MNRIIFVLLSPYKASQYDFVNFFLPNQESLLFIADKKTLENNLPSNLLNYSIEINLAPDPAGVIFLSLTDIENLIQEYSLKGYQIYLHSEEERFLDQVARLNQKYHLEGLNISQMAVFRDKFIMKQQLTNNTRHFKIPRYCNNKKDALQLNLPVIYKPLSYAGAFGVKRINTAQELNDFLSTKVDFDYIVEEFIEGDLYHCDALVYEGELYFYLSAKEFYSIEYATQHLPYIGSEIFDSGSLYSKLQQATLSIVKWLSVPNSMVHIEFICRDNEVYFVEIGKRPAGGWIPALYQISRGINIFNLHIYSCYSNGLFLENIIALFKQKYKYSCGFHHLLTQSGILTDVIFPENISCGHTYRIFTKKINNFQNKTNSMFDAVAESILFSNDLESYASSLDLLANKTRVISRQSD